MLKKSPDSFDALSRFNHWVVAIIVIGMLGFGAVLENVEFAKETKGFLIGLHKAIGATFLVFAVWRVGYRLMQGFPAPASPMPAWQDMAAKVVHWVLLAAILIMPVSGLMMSLFGGHDVNVFGLFTIPAFEKSKALSGIGHFAHGFTANVLIGAIALHVAAALKHHYIDKDVTLARMLGRATAKEGGGHV